MSERDKKSDQRDKQLIRTDSESSSDSTSPSPKQEIHELKHTHIRPAFHRMLPIRLITGGK